MADHALRLPADEVYVRWYIKPLQGFTFGAEKILTFNKRNPGDGGIDFGCLSNNCGGSPRLQAVWTMGVTSSLQDECMNTNVTPGFQMDSGKWYFVEAHMKLNTPGVRNGVFELWVDDCGAAGTSCPATPTKRMARTDVGYNRSSGDMIKTLWFEHWSNPVSRGERYLDQIKVSKVGPIGGMK